MEDIKFPASGKPVRMHFVNTIDHTSLHDNAPLKLNTVTHFGGNFLLLHFRWQLKVTKGPWISVWRDIMVLCHKSDELRRNHTLKITTRNVNAHFYKLTKLFFNINMTLNIKINISLLMYYLNLWIIETYLVKSYCLKIVGLSAILFYFIRRLSQDIRRVI